MAASVISAQNSSMKDIDLNNYYTKFQGFRVIHCQICRCNFLKDHVFEHTISLRHKYNKLYVATLQERSSNLDSDFVVLNVDRLQCRYCDSLIINSNRDYLITDHIQDIGHMTRKQNFLTGKITNGKTVSTIEYHLLQPLDSLIIHNKKYQNRMNQPQKINAEENSGMKVQLAIVQPKNTGNVDQTSFLEYTAFAIQYERERGEELPKCITIRGNAMCYCTICSTEIPKSCYNVRGHIYGKKHKSKEQASPSIHINTKLLLEPAKLKIEKSIKDSKGTNDIGQSNDPQPSAFFNNTEARSERELSVVNNCVENGAYICTFCQIEVPNNSYNIDQHVNGERHRKKLNQTQSGKKSSDHISVEKNAALTCPICCIKIPSDCMDQHVKGESHKKKLNQTQSGKKSSDHISVEEKVARTCPLCCIKIPSGCMDQHVNGERHKKKLNRTESGQKSSDYIRVGKDVARTCPVCCIKIPLGGMDQHVNGALPYTCRICQVSLDGQVDLLEHNNGMEHLTIHYNLPISEG